MAPVAPPIEWLHAATDRINVIDLPVRRMLAVDGLGEPRGIVFTESVEALREVIHLIGARHTAAPHERAPSGHLEALWWIGEPGGRPMTPQPTRAGREPSSSVRFDRMRESQPDAPFRWRLMLELPPAAGEDTVLQAIDAARSEKHERLGLDRVEIATLAESRCAQILHIGPFATESTTLDRLEAGVVRHGYRLLGPHHEIYLSDVRRTDPSRWRTIIRYPVRAVTATVGAAPAEVTVAGEEPAEGTTGSMAPEPASPT